jgi:hypothetical protein
MGSGNAKRTHNIYNRVERRWWQGPGQGMTEFSRFAWRWIEQDARSTVDGHADLMAVPITENP